MNKQKFVEFIRKPHDLTTEDLKSIRETLEAYPYFSNARIILAKGCKIKGADDTKERIASAAIYSTDRGLLKKYINDELIFLRSLDVSESATSGKSAKTPPPEQLKKETPKEETPVKQETSPEEPKPTESAPTSAAIIKVDEPIKAPSSDDSSDLDHLISDLWKDIEEMRKSKARFEEIEKKIEEEDAVDKAVKKATQKSKSKPTTSRTKKTTATTKKTTAKKTVTKKTSSTAKKPAAKKQTTTTRKKAGDTKKADNSDDKKSDPKGDQSLLIDNFIKLSPTMPPAKSSGDQRIGDLSENSTQLDPDLASEYLAEIFLEQGKTDRAVQIYEALIVRFPENSAYFAGIIKKLKE